MAEETKKNKEEEILNKDFKAEEEVFEKRLSEMLAEAQVAADKIVKAAEEKAAGILRKESKGKEESLPDGFEKTEKYMAEPVTIRLFKDGNKYKDDVFVSVNGQRYQIQRGVEVEVPRFVKEVLDNSITQDEKTAEYVSGLVARYEKKSEKF